MKKLLALFIPMIASTLSAQTSTAVQIAASSCGAFNAAYKVTTADTDAAIPAPATSPSASTTEATSSAQ